MACVSPPELDGKALLTYIDDEADYHVAAHMRRCSHCREKAQRLARLQDRLTNQLYRLTCPSSTELGEYQLGVLLHGHAATVARHLSECPHCSREIVLLQNYLGELTSDLEIGPLERIRVLVTQLVFGGQETGWPRAPILTPGYTSLRGEEQGPYLYQADDVQIAVEVQDDAEQQGHKVLLGLIVGVDSHELKARLWQAKQRIAATAPVDNLGNFIIPSLAPGSYDLIFSGPEVEVHIQGLEI